MIPAFDAARLPAQASPTMAAAPIATAHPTPSPEPSPMMRRVSFTWTGAGGSSHKEWNYLSNWSAPGGTGYPDDSSDDATLSLCNFDIILDASRTIDDLTMSPSSTGCESLISGNGSTRTLTCDTLTISGDTSGSEDGVRMMEGAGIVTN